MSGDAGQAKLFVTPDSFAVAPELLGRPLARPWRRGMALATDLLLVGLVSRAGGLVLGACAAVFLFRLATRTRDSSFGRRWARRALGCGGGLLLLLTIVAAFGHVRFTVRDPDEAPVRIFSEGGSEVSLSALGALGSLADALALQRARGAREAGDAARRLVARLTEGGMGPGEARALLGGLDEMGLPPAAREALRVELARVAAEGGGEGEAVATAELARAWLAARAELDAAGTGTADAAAEREAESRDRLMRRLAEPLLVEASARVERLERLNRQLADDLVAARAGPSLRAATMTFLDDLGVGLGWSALYFTLFPTIWRGRTPGKRLFGLRIQRLDGRPLSAWGAFERFGGYAACVATCLLGFAQVAWDANRQGLHDKIASTVVLRDREALSAP